MALNQGTQKFIICYLISNLRDILSVFHKLQLISILYYLFIDTLFHETLYKSTLNSLDYIEIIVIITLAITIIIIINIVIIFLLLLSIYLHRHSNHYYYHSITIIRLVLRHGGGKEHFLLIIT